MTKPVPTNSDDDSASESKSADDDSSIRDPRKTDHPVGEEQAQRNADDEPAG